MNIAEQLQEDLKTAMRAGEKTRVGVIRMARAALQTAQQERAKERYDLAAREIEQRLASDAVARDAALAAIVVDPREPLDETAQQTVLSQEIKKRQNAAEIFRKNGRPDRAEEEEEEIRILTVYLPKQMSAEELRPEVAALISELGLSGAQAMGKLMPTLLERFKGRADGRVLSQLARELLAQG